MAHRLPRLQAGTVKGYAFFLVVGGWRETCRLPLLPHKMTWDDTCRSKEAFEMWAPKRVMACRLPRLQAGTVKTRFAFIVGGWSENCQLRPLPLLPQTAMIGFWAVLFQARREAAHHE